MPYSAFASLCEKLGGGITPGRFAPRFYTVLTNTLSHCKYSRLSAAMFGTRSPQVSVQDADTLPA